MLITLKDLLGKTEYSTLPAEHQANLMTLLEKVNKLVQKWGKSSAITSGYRSMNDHLRIYKEKGITDPKKIPMKSKHLSGAACDIYDPGLKFTAWLKDPNNNILEELDLYCEDGNKNWVHVQIQPFGSYKPGQTRWFKP